jgi:hypothetical protein
MQVSFEYGLFVIDRVIVVVVEKRNFFERDG